MNVSHIAVLNPSAEIGGAEISLLELARHLKDHPRVTLILPGDGPLREAASKLRLEARIVQWPERLTRMGERAGLPGMGKAAMAAGLVPALVWNLAKLLRRISPDALVTNGVKAHFLGSLACRRLSIPVLWYLRDGLEGRRISPQLLRWVAGRCDGAIAISHYIEDQWRQVVPAGKTVRVLYNIVDTERFQPGLGPPSDLRKGKDEVWFAMIGAITPLKGQDLFLEAAALVAKRLPLARFLVIGTNVYATESQCGYPDKLRSLAEELGLGDRALFLGQRHDIPQLLSLIDVLVQPNRGPEGLGRSVLEAMACAVPVIAVDRWGPAEILQRSQAGLLMPWMDVPALAGLMIQLGGEPRTRARLGSVGREWIEANIRPELIAGEFRECVQTVVRAALVSSKGKNECPA